MVARLQKAELLARNEVVAAPAQRACNDQTFELPTALYGAMAAFFFAFLTVMTVGFPHGTMVLPMAVNFIFVGMFFAVPAVIVRANPEKAKKALRWDRFAEHGVMTPNGRAGAAEATILMLILPALIFLWGVAVVTIAALV
jgi:hypothetical protein